MGRGRAKAKQTKVARRLKYYSPDTDLSALERELKTSEADGGSSYSAVVPDEDQEQYIADHYGRGQRRIIDAEGSDPGDADDDLESSTESGSKPASRMTPGSWMNKT